MDKLFAVAGVSRINGVLKTRVAKDMNRVKVLEKNDHIDVRLIELPNQMVKLDAVSYLLTHDLYQDEESQAAIKDRIARLQAKSAKAEKATGTATDSAPATSSTVESVADIVADIVANSQEVATAAPSAAKRPSRSKAAIAEREAAKTAVEG